jgi:FkbM family methyltransferase
MRALLKDLCPPILLRMLRKLRPVPPPAPPAQAGSTAQWCSVSAGPVQGCNMLLNTKAAAFAQMAAGTYDDFLWQALNGIVISGGTIIDAGAHIGYHSLGLARLFPGCQVQAFEPNPANQQRIREHLQANTELATRITLHGLALADREGEEELSMNSRVDDETSSGSHLVRAFQALPEQVYRKAGYATQRVQVRSLDAIADQEGWTDVRLMKIDVEGAEHLLLRGAQALMKRDKPLLLLEVHGAACMLEVLAVLHPLGYTTRLLHEDGPARCFIVASAI